MDLDGSESRAQTLFRGRERRGRPKKERKKNFRLNHIPNAHRKRDRRRIFNGS